MITILTSHNHIWQIDQVVSGIIKEYLDTGKVVISMNNEGPCLDSIGLYKLLDTVHKQFNIDPAQITIFTANFEEQSDIYNIKRLPQHWIPSTIKSWQKYNALPPKTFSNLFGCLYNVPSWDRLCLLSYIKRNSQHTNLLYCNGTWEPNRYNTYYLNDLIDNAATELLNVATYLESEPVAALDDVQNTKPTTADQMMSVYPLYRDFLVDVVAETYNVGLSFFITEKTLRPILALTPFIINAPQGFLSTLKSDYGIKSFDKWWDESYDNYQGYDRIKKIYQVVDYLNSLPQSQWGEIYSDMLPTLMHNQQQLQKHIQ